MIEGMIEVKSKLFTEPQIVQLYQNMLIIEFTVNFHIFTCSLFPVNKLTIIFSFLCSFLLDRLLQYESVDHSSSGKDTIPLHINSVKCNLTKLTTTSLAVKRFTSVAVKQFTSIAVKRFTSLAVERSTS